MKVVTVFDECPGCGKSLGEFQLIENDLKPTHGVKVSKEGLYIRKVTCTTCSGTADETSE